jgi:hypothetical protein
MRKNIFAAFRASAALILGAMVASSCSRPDGPISKKDSGYDRPEIIILISLNTLRADHLGFYGYERSTSPVLDAFSDQGNRSLRRSQYKLIFNSKDRDWAVYDLENDPQEAYNLASRKLALVAEIALEMRARYAGFDPSPAPEDRVELDADELERLRALGYVP